MKKKIPEFKTKESTAAFWDSHDFIDYIVSERKPQKPGLARRDDEAICLFCDEIASSLRSSQ